MYEFDLKSVIKEIKKQNAKRVLLHLPDGIKPRAEEIQEEIKKNVDVEVFIWAGSCYGACDLPMESKSVGVDLIVHFGHTKWRND